MAECFRDDCDGAIETVKAEITSSGGFERARCSKCGKIFTLAEVLAELDEVTGLWHHASDLAATLSRNPIFED